MSLRATFGIVISIYATDVGQLVVADGDHSDDFSVADFTSVTIFLREPILFAIF